MDGAKVQRWVEGYLYSARGHRALEQSVLAAGEREGFSERKLIRAGRSLGVQVVAGCWELSSLRAEALDARLILTLGEPIPAAPRPSLPAVGQISPDTPIRARRAA